MAKTAKQWHCYTCNSAGGAGKGPAKCPRCGAKPLVTEGVYGVFRWTGTGRYPLEDALGTRLTERAAEALRERLDPGDLSLVVRFI